MFNYFNFERQAFFSLEILNARRTRTSALTLDAMKREKTSIRVFVTLTLNAISGGTQPSYFCSARAGRGGKPNFYWFGFLLAYCTVRKLMYLCAECSAFTNMTIVYEAKYSPLDLLKQ